MINLLKSNISNIQYKICECIVCISMCEIFLTHTHTHARTHKNNTQMHFSYTKFYANFYDRFLVGKIKIPNMRIAKGTKHASNVFYRL